MLSPSFRDKSIFLDPLLGDRKVFVERFFFFETNELGQTITALKCFRKLKFILLVQLFMFKQIADNHRHGKFFDFADDNGK